MLKWTASSQRLNELPAAQPRLMRRQRRERRATIANKENVPDVRYTSTPMPLARLRNSPLVLAPLSDIRNVTPDPKSSASASPRRIVQSVRYATTLPRYEEEYSPSGVTVPLPSGQHLALRGLLPLDPFLEQPRYMAANSQQLRKRKLESDFVATMEEASVVPVPVSVPEPRKSMPQQQHQLRPVTPQPSTQMSDQTLDKLIDAILDSACKADASSKKKPRKSFNLRRRTLVKQQLESECAAILSPSYTPGDDPASDLNFALLPLPATPEPASPINRLPHSLLLQYPTPQPIRAAPAKATAPAPAPDTPTASAADLPQEASHSDTFCLATPVRPLKRSRVREAQTARVESPLKRYKVDARNYFEVGLALPSSIYV